MPRLHAHHLLLAVALLVLPALACGDGPAQGGAAAGEVDFQLATLDGEKLGPGDFHGQVVLVDFWATWCVPCHAQQEVLDDVHEAVGDEVQFLAVDVGEQESMVRGFVEKKPFPYPVLLDPESRVADSLGVYSLPTLMILDAEGEVSYQEAGVLGKRQVCDLLADAGSTAAC